jgi:hypothetical protein
MVDEYHLDLAAWHGGWRQEYLVLTRALGLRPARTRWRGPSCEGSTAPVRWTRAAQLRSAGACEDCAAETRKDDARGGEKNRNELVRLCNQWQWWVISTQLHE